MKTGNGGEANGVWKVTVKKLVPLSPVPVVTLTCMLLSVPEIEIAGEPPVPWAALPIATVGVPLPKTCVHVISPFELIATGLGNKFASEVAAEATSERLLLGNKFPEAVPVTFAVIVPQEKLPEESRFTIVETVSALVALFAACSALWIFAAVEPPTVATVAPAVVPVQSPPIVIEAELSPVI